MKIGKEPTHKLQWIYQDKNNSDKFILGYKGISYFEEIKPTMIYAPYIPIMGKISRWKKIKWAIQGWFRRVILRKKSYVYPELKREWLTDNTLKSSPNDKPMFVDFKRDK